MIDYVIVNEEMWEKVDFELTKEWTRNTPHLVEYTTKMMEDDEAGRNVGKEKRKVMSWREEDVEDFKKKTEVIEEEELENRTVEERWEEIKRIVKNSVNLIDLKRKSRKLGVVKVRKW